MEVILGVFRDDLIQIGCDDVQDIKDSDLSGIDTLTCSDEELSAYITDLANQQEAKLQENIKQFNKDILFRVYSWMRDCSYPFWEHPNFVNQEFVQAHPNYEVNYGNSFEGVPAELEYEERHALRLRLLARTLATIWTLNRTTLKLLAL